jgi:hypothetical protein
MLVLVLLPIVANVARWYVINEGQLSRGKQGTIGIVIYDLRLASCATTFKLHTVYPIALFSFSLQQIHRVSLGLFISSLLSAYVIYSITSSLQRIVDVY